MKPEETNELEKLHRAVNRLEKLLEISRTLNANLHLDNLLLSIISAATQLTNTAAASILLLDKRTGLLYFEATTSRQKEVLAHMLVPLEESIAGWIVTHNQPLILNEASQDPRHFTLPDQKTNFETKALLGVPLQVKGKTIGALEVLNPKDNALFTEDDLQTITTLAAQAAVAIENASLFRQSDQIAEIAHELRTPITAIIGFSKLLLVRENLDRETQRSFLETINQEAKRLGDMINDFLDLARLETRRILLEMAPINLSKIVLEAISLLRPQADDNNLKLAYNIPPAALTIVADAAHIKQVMVNLISNAIKYNRPGGNIDICLRQLADCVKIVVADTGLGMPAETTDNIFDKFYRVTEHETKAKGTGLGLSIVKEIVEAHGGSVSVESTLNQGSSFTVKLPLEQR